MNCFIATLQNTIIGDYCAEIIFFLFKIAEAMLEPSVRLYIYQSVCLDTYPMASMCFTQIKDEDDSERERFIQESSASYIIAYKVLINLPAIVLGLFCGAWSDKIGRKLPVMLPCLGTIFAVLLYMLSILDGMPTIALVLLGAFLRGAFGKSAIITMALHSYIADLSTRDERTSRFGRLLAMNYFGYFVGSMAAGALLGIATFDIIFCVVIFIDCICVFTSLIFMKESLFYSVTEDEQTQSKKSKNPFKVEHIRESLNVLIKPREHGAHWHLLALFFTILLNQMSKSGEVDITLLFVERYPLRWEKQLYGYLLATDYACLGISVFFLLPVLSTGMDIHDMTLILVGLLFKVIRLIIIASARSTWLVFLSVIIGCPSALIISGAKSLISKIVHEDEIGKAFSLLSCGETVSNMIGSLLLTGIYSALMPYYAGSTFLLASGVNAIWLVIMILLYKDIKSVTTYKILDEETTKSSYGSGGEITPKCDTCSTVNGIKPMYIDERPQIVNGNNRSTQQRDFRQLSTDD